jgi:hypothetical protein
LKELFKDFPALDLTKFHPESLKVFYELITNSAISYSNLVLNEVFLLRSSLILREIFLQIFQKNLLI